MCFLEAGEKMEMGNSEKENRERNQRTKRSMFSATGDHTGWGTTETRVWECYQLELQCSRSLHKADAV